MAIYRVQAPDGSILRVEGPDDARPEEIEAFAAQQFGAQKRQPSPPPKSPASSNLPGTAPGGRWADAANVFMGERGQEIWDALRKGTLGTGAVLAELLPERLKSRVQDAVVRRTEEIDRAAKAPGNKEAMDALREEFPVTGIVAPAAVDMAFPLGRATKGAGVLRQAAEMAVPGAIPGLLTADNQGANALMTAGATALGTALTGGIGKLVAPGVKAASPEAGRLAEVAAKEGIGLDVAQATGGKVAQNVKAALNAVPWTAGAQQADDAARQVAYNKAILSRLKSNAEAATPDVMADIHARITGDLGKAVEGVTLTVDEPLFNAMAEIEAKHLRKLPTDQRGVIMSYLEDVLGAADKGIPGDTYATARSELGKLAYRSDHSQVVDAAKAIQNALDSAFDRQAPAANVALMKEARPAYKLYSEVAEAVQKARATDGSIPARQFYAAVQRHTPGFERGAGGDVAEVARAGRAFLPDPVPDSGTSQRALYQSLVTMGSMGGLGGLGAMGAAFTGNDPTTGALLGLGGFASARAARAALNSPNLTRHLMRDLTAGQRAAIARAGGLAGLGFASSQIE